MRKKIIISAALIAIAASLAWAGGDVWKTKRYQQWNQKDVQQVLNNSPWGKVQSVPAAWRSNGLSADRDSGMQPSEPAGAPRSGSEGVGGGGAGGPGTMGGGQAGQSPPNGPGAPQMAGGMGEGAAYTPFFVRWNSAQTIREALARDALLSSKINEADAQRFVTQTPPDYEILVTGPDMSPFATTSEADLKAMTHLEAKQSKQKIAPTSVKINRTSDNKRVTFILFSFPREASANQPFVTPKDKNVEFECKLKNLDLRSNFDVRKMVNEKGQDL